ncbi:hypothetical protein E5163_07380 [Marinicauda algicola]|uniref:Uncharacterized protein n=1 Tax=Marinicauda algicola TaxID=2029849 RepID=A0A4S2H096_9PROT|nr:hypothetical protein [Marinicauda algicola]TGY88947.1 hypothetical protein E5163_07380 [Marinicauda algicola]
MIALAAALMMQQAAPPDGGRAECWLTGDVRGRTVMSLQPVCPDEAPDAPALQAYAESLLARTALPITVPEAAHFNSSVELVWDGQGWSLPEPFLLVHVPAVYPERAMMRQLNAVCDGYAIVGGDGLARDVALFCQAFNSNGSEIESRLFLDPAREAVQQNVWLIAPDLELVCEPTKVAFDQRDDPGEPGELPRLDDARVPACPPGLPRGPDHDDR